jgi:hypothetical protein
MTDCHACWIRRAVYGVRGVNDAVSEKHEKQMVASF